MGAILAKKIRHNQRNMKIVGVSNFGIAFKNSASIFHVICPCTGERFTDGKL